MCLATLNLANPDAMIVRANIARHGGRELDAAYLTTLSADATPELVRALGALDARSRGTVAAGLREQRRALSERSARQGWPAWSVARSRALAELAPFR